MSFADVLREAVADFAERGYSSQFQLDDWVARIRDAAEAELVPQVRVDAEVKKLLGDVYSRQVVHGAIVQRHPEVPRFTIERIKPAARAELHRAIHASADLIKLDRARAIEETIQRFAGWASSVPRGGSGVVQRRAVQSMTRKALQRVAYEQRRVAIDQGHKFAAALDRILADESGAIAAQWHRHFTRYPREAHIELDGKWLLIRDSWAHERGLVKPGPMGFTDQHPQPGEEILCFSGDTKIEFADGVEVAYRRWFSGEATELVMVSGKTLRVTPNHPVLSPSGWVPAGLLNDGDEVFEVSSDIVGPCSVVEDQDNAVPSIGEVFETCLRLGFLQKSYGRSDQFHGDGSDSDIDVVLTDRKLTFGRKSLIDQRLDKFDLPSTNYSSPGIGNLLEFLFGSRLSGAFVRRTNLICSLFRGHEFPALYHLLTSNLAHSRVGIGSHGQSLLSGSMQIARDRAFFDSSESNSRINEPPNYDAVTLNAEFPRNPFGALEILRVHADDLLENFFRKFNFLTFRDRTTPFRRTRVRSARRVQFDGHVYNLQTASGWYVAGGIIAHNCRCTCTYYSSLSRLPDYLLTDLGRETLAEARRKAAA